MDKPIITDQPPPYSATMSQGSQPYVQTHQPYPQPYPQPASGLGATYPPPPPGYTPQGAPVVTGYVPNYGATNIIIQPPIIAVGACPACRVGMLEDDFTCLGIMCAIVFFPLGILCCLALKNRRCSNCGALFG